MVADSSPVAEPHPALVPATYQVAVDYGQTLEQMIAAGRYDTRDIDINQNNFPLDGAGKVEVELSLVHLGNSEINSEISADEVLAELGRRGLRPAKIGEILALGAKYPNLQKVCPINALGSVFLSPMDGRYIVSRENRSGDRSSPARLIPMDGRYTVSLDTQGGARTLRLCWRDAGWVYGACFLAVSK